VALRILTNTTSPYARIARIALAEKGFDLGDTQIVNPWSDDVALLKLNPASRVPTLELDSGLPLTESLLIVAWLERKIPKPSLLDGDVDNIISRAGLAMGVIDAMGEHHNRRHADGPELGGDARWPQAPTHDRNGLSQARFRSAALWRRHA
jgi:glutathione S-transferase